MICEISRVSTKQYVPQDQYQEIRSFTNIYISGNKKTVWYISPSRQFKYFSLRLNLEVNGESIMNHFAYGLSAPIWLSLQ